MAITSISGITSYAIQDIFKPVTCKELADIEIKGFSQIQNLASSDTKLKSAIYQLLDTNKQHGYDIHISMASPHKLEEKADNLLHTNPQFLKDFRDTKNNSNTSSTNNPAELSTITVQEGKNIGIFCSNNFSNDNIANLTKSIQRVNSFVESGKFPQMHIEFPQKARIDQKSLKKIESLSTADLTKCIQSGLIKDISNDGLKPFHRQNKQNDSRSIAGNIVTVDSAESDTIMFQYLAEQRIQKGDIVFYNDSANHQHNEKYAKTGGLLLQIAIKHGMGGLVSKGNFRDIEEYAEKDFPAFAAGHVPNGPTKVNGGSIYSPIKWQDNFEVSTNDVCLIRGNNRYIVPQEHVEQITNGNYTKPQNYSSSQNHIINKDIIDIAEQHRLEKYNEYQSSIKNTINKTNDTANTSLLTHQTLSHDLLERLYHAPPAEIADALSTLTPSYVCGFTTDAKHMTKMTGLSVVFVSDNKKDVISRINKLKSKDILVLITKGDKLKIDNKIIRVAHNKKIAGIISNAPIEKPNFKTEISIASIDSKDITHIDEITQNIKIQNIPINTGYAIVSDPDGTVAIPPQFIEHALRGANGIRQKEDQTIVAIETGTAKNKDLPRDIVKLNGHNLGYNFAIYNIASEPALPIARGSSNLVISIPQMVKVIGNASKFKELTHKQITEKASELGKNERIKGTITKLILQDGTEPPVFELKTRAGNAYITDIEGDKFNELSLAQEKQRSVTITADDIKVSKVSAVVPTV
jgi:regulator of RNase E activity RraA